MASRGSSLGTGGMSTKLVAADLATAAGVRTVITHGAKPANLMKIIEADDNGTLITPHELPVVTGDDLLARGLPLHTLFTAKDNLLHDRKWWIKHGLHTAGRIYIDEGAMKAILSKKQRSSLFAAGIMGVEKNFVANQAVMIVYQRKDEDGHVVEEIDVGKGIVNYSSVEIGRIRGCQSHDITDILGYMDAESVIDRDNLVRILEDAIV